MLFLTVILFILILSVLVIVHELGHFIFAKRNGIYVEEFGWGLPPRLIGFYKSSKTGKRRSFLFNANERRKDIDSTIYSISAIPFGGFCKMLGEDETVASTKSFSQKTPWARFKVVVAGVVFNLILSWLLLCVWYWIIPNHIGNEIIIAGVNANSPAQIAGIKQNDFIQKINGEKLKTAEDLTNFTQTHKGEEAIFTIKRYNRESDYKVKLGNDDYPLGVSMTDTGGDIYKPKWYLTPAVVLEEMWSIIAANAVFLYKLVVSIFTGVKHTTEAVSGPVGIFTFLYQIINSGSFYVIRFMAILSLALGFFNILPFPALDGGRLIFIGAEMIFKKKIIRSQLENVMHSIGFAILLLLIAVVTYNDISRLIK